MREDEPRRRFSDWSLAGAGLLAPLCRGHGLGTASAGVCVHPAQPHPGHLFTHCAGLLEYLIVCFLFVFINPQHACTRRLEESLCLFVYLSICLSVADLSKMCLSVYLSVSG